MTLRKKIIITLLALAAFFLVGYIAQSSSLPAGVRYAISAAQYAVLIAVLLAIVFHAARSTYRTHRFDSFLLLLISGFLALVSIPFYFRMMHHYFKMASGQTQSVELYEPSHMRKIEMIKEIRNKSQFDEFIAQNSAKPAVIKVSATWCSPCKMMKPIFEKVAQALHHTINFADIDIDVFGQKEILGVTGVPVILYYKNGREVGRYVGYRNEENLRNDIERLCL
jgi:thioredoxin 1